MRYLSVCSGIEAATIAWHPLGWTPVAFCEIDKFASAVLAERFGSNMPGEPLARNGVPNHGDFTAIDLASLPKPIDLLVGGTPCQAFSFAGKRLSLADARGNLTLAYAVLAHELARSHGLRIAVWENVPGVLSTDDNAFGCFLGALVGADSAIDLPRGAQRWPDSGMVAGPRARLAWRLLDAQYFGLAQRRERVFVVVDFGNGADPAAVLFESQGLSGNTPPRREAGQRPAPTVSTGIRGSGDFELAGGLTCYPINEPDAGWNANGTGIGANGDPAPTLQAGKVHAVAFGGNNTSGPIDIATAVNAHGGPKGRCDFESETFVACDLSASLTVGANQTTGLATEVIAHTLRAEGFDASEDGTGRGTPLVPICFQSNGSAENLTATVDLCHTLKVGADSGWGNCPAIAQGWAVRRLTPVECARLQGFPDHHSRIPWRGKSAELCPDGPQYKTYGNSMAVACMRWLGQRIEMVMAS